MAANFLSGVSVGAHQGLANLVTSKRAERAAKRDQRRYEGELMLRLGQAKSDRDYRNKMFAYQVSRDTVRDRQWAKSHGLQVDMFESDEAHRADTLAETVRSNKEAEADRDAARLQDQEQFDASLAESIRSRTDRNELTRLGILEDSRQTDEALRQRKQEHIDSVKDQSLARQLQSQQQQTQSDYYNDIIRLREQELKRPLTELEKRKIEAEIRLKESQADYYDRRGDGSPGTGGITFPQSISVTEDYSAAYGNTFLDQFTSQGKKFTIPFIQRQVNENWFWGRLNWDIPFRMDRVLPWDSADPNADTQRGRLRSLGAEVFQGLIQQMNGDAQAAANRIPTFFNELMEDTSNPERQKFVSYLMHAPLKNPQTGQPYTELEMLRKAQEEMMTGADQWYQGRRSAARTPAAAPGSANDPILDMQ